jgi:CO/xanthine dehydrogenase Mo-binding subunit
VPVSKVRVEWRDTTVSPDAGSSSASRQTVASGNAVLRACAAARRLVERKGGLHHVPGGTITVRRTWRFPATQLFDRRPARHLADFGWGACVADVSVDRETGQVTVLRVVNAVDAGCVINPRLFAGQVEGGVVMGQGYALQERVVVHEGMPMSTGFESCGVPTAVDAVPKIGIIAVEAHDAPGPFGSRGIAEITMIPVVPAITAAIHAACGVWIDELPATPLRVLAAIARAEHGSSGIPQNDLSRR